MLGRGTAGSTRPFIYFGKGFSPASNNRERVGGCITRLGISSDPVCLSTESAISAPFCSRREKRVGLLFSLISPARAETHHADQTRHSAHTGYQYITRRDGMALCVYTQSPSIYVFMLLVPNPRRPSGALFYFLFSLSLSPVTQQLLTVVDDVCIVAGISRTQYFPPPAKNV